MVSEKTLLSKGYRALDLDYTRFFFFQAQLYILYRKGSEGPVKHTKSLFSMTISARGEGFKSN